MRSYYNSLNCKTLLAVLFTFLLSSITSLQAAPKRYQGDQTAIALREMRDTLDDMRHEVSNHEHEIKTYEEKIRNLETIIESFSTQTQDTAQAHKEALKDSSANLEMKINSLETTAKGLVADLKQFKAHANETASTLTQYKQKLIDLEKILELQNQNMENLQNAFKSLTEILQVKSSVITSTSAPSGNMYKVASGDSLEKIARKNQTTIQAIKEINGLANDRIIVGQTLKMP
jgi:LysM repeat protein